MKPPVLCSALLLLCAAAFPAQEAYTGPRPPKTDVPYLMHADNLVETEVSQAREQQRGKDEVAYIVPGASSPARTPLAEPIFLIEADKISPEALGLYRMEVKNGNREVVISQKKRGARPLRLMVTRIEGRLFRVEVNESLGLENGEYSLSPQGSNDVFCFQVY
ncbi:MAG TPA: hypothetical protein VHA11_00485 [Bryobacteraceae bacterium]|nr:hypothetical protein [Bryobacteraceae bacterium]